MFAEPAQGKESMGVTVGITLEQVDGDTQML